MTRVLDAIADPEKDTTTSDKAHTIARKGLNAVKARRQAQEIGNEKPLAETQKLLKEAGTLTVQTEAGRIENDDRRPATPKQAASTACCRC